MMAEFESFQTLRQMLSINRWTGGKSQKQLQKEYFKEQLWGGEIALTLLFVHPPDIP